MRVRFSTCHRYELFKNQCVFSTHYQDTYSNRISRHSLVIQKFVCDIVDSVPKYDAASMENPLFSLSTKPDYKAREYSNQDKWLKVSPSPSVLATVHDRDILIYCISQCMAALKQGQSIEKTLRFKAVGLLIFTSRNTSGNM